MTDHENPDIGQENGALREGRFSHDSFWKDLAGRFFYPLIKRALPELYDDADAGTQPRFLDKEFGDVLNTADPEIHTNSHFADFVLEVPLKDGTDRWVLVHCEAQGSGGGNLAERMNFYRHSGNDAIFSNHRVPACRRIMRDENRMKIVGAFS
jgi:hypothetical protein